MAAASVSEEATVDSGHRSWQAANATSADFATGRSSCSRHVLRVPLLLGTWTGSAFVGHSHYSPCPGTVGAADLVELPHLTKKVPAACSDASILYPTPSVRIVWHDLVPMVSYLSPGDVIGRDALAAAVRAAATPASARTRTNLGPPVSMLPLYLNPGTVSVFNPSSTLAFAHSGTC